MEKEITLFNKNHVTISYIPFSKMAEKNRIEFREYRTTMYPKGMTITTKKKRYENFIKESPLGFFYETREEVEYEEESPFGVEAIFHQLSVTVGTKWYLVKYPYSCGDVKVGFDARPWDICVGDLSMKEHFIKAIKKILDEIFVSVANVKHCDRTKERVYTEMFGNVKGYDTMANDIKVVSHGFDLKESFRKRKIKKVKKNGKKKEVCTSLQ